MFLVNRIFNYHICGYKKALLVFPIIFMANLLKGGPEGCLWHERRWINIVFHFAARNLQLPLADGAMYVLVLKIVHAQCLYLDI